MQAKCSHSVNYVKKSNFTFPTFFSDGGAIFLNSAASTSAALPANAPGTEPLGAAEPFQQAEENGRSAGYRAVSVENIPPTHTAQLEVSRE